MVNFCCSGSSANFCSYSRNRFPCTSASVLAIVLATGNSVGITVDPKFSFVAGFPAPAESLGQFFAKVCYCSVDTELIENQFNGFFTTVEVNRFLSSSFAFQFSSIQGTGGTKYRMSAFGKVEHHAFSSFIPFSIRFVEMVSVPSLLRTYSVILNAFAIEFSLFPRFVQ